MERKIEKWRRGCAALAVAGLMALVLAACSDGSSLGAFAADPGSGAPTDPIVPQEPVAVEPDPAPPSTPPSLPVEHTVLTIKRGFDIEIKSASANVGTEVTVSTVDFEPSVPGELTNDMVEEVVVKFDGRKVTSTFEIGKTDEDDPVAEIRAKFKVPDDAAAGEYKVALKINSVTSATETYQVSALSRKIQGGGVHVQPIPQVNVSQEVGSSATPTAAPILIAAGEKHTCATKGNRVYCWGSSEFQQLGDGARYHQFQASTGGASNSSNYDCRNFTPNPVVVLEGASSENKQFDASGVTKLIAGANHTCALKDDGAVWCWGSNSYGQLGGGYKGNQCAPQKNDQFGAVQVIADDNYDPSSSDRTLPTGPLENIISIAASGDRTCALNREGKLYCWGYRPNLLNYRASSSPQSVCAAVRVTATNQESLGKILDFAVADHSIYIRRELDTAIYSLTQDDRLNKDPYLYSFSLIPNLNVLSNLVSRGDILCGINGDPRAECRRNGTYGLEWERISLDDVHSVHIGEPGQFGGAVCLVHDQDRHISCRDRYDEYNGDGWSSVSGLTMIKNEDKIEDVVSVAVGTEYFCYVDSSNRIVCGGNCSLGQCGVVVHDGPTLTEIKLP